MVDLAYSIALVFGVLALLFLIYPVFEEIFSYVAYPASMGMLRAPIEKDRIYSNLISIIFTFIGLFAVTLTTAIAITLPAFLTSSDERISSHVWSFAWISALSSSVIIRLFAQCYTIEFCRFAIYQMIFLLLVFAIGATPIAVGTDASISNFLKLELGKQPMLIPISLAVVAFALSEIILWARTRWLTFSVATARHLTDLLASCSHKFCTLSHRGIIEQAVSQIQWERRNKHAPRTIRWIASECPGEIVSELAIYIASGTPGARRDVRIIALNDRMNIEILRIYNLLHFAKFVDYIGSSRMLLLNDRRGVLASSVGPSYDGRHQRRSNMSMVETGKLELHVLRMSFDSWWDEII